MTPRRPSNTARYGGAIAIASLAVVLRWALIPWLGADTPFATVIAATAIAVWMGGCPYVVVNDILGCVGQ